MITPAQPPAVLQVLPALDTGGVERGTIEITAALAEAGWRPFVASAGGRMAAEVARAGGVHLGLPLQSKDPWVIWRNAARLGEIVRGHGIDIIHARSRAPAWSAKFAARRTGAAFVTTYHGTYNEGLPFKRIYNAVMASGDRVIAISDFIANHLIARHGTDPARVRVIPRGVDPARFDPTAIGGDRMRRLAEAWRLPDGAPIVVLPGRLTRWKGQTVLIEALARMARTDAVAVLVGDAQGREGYRDELLSLAHARGVAERLRLAGDCTDMPAGMMLADAVVSASTDPEAFGRVVIEGQAMGRPVVATAHGGAAETITDGQTGWLVQPGDAAALAARLDAVLGLGGEERAALAERARAAVLARYTTALMCAATLAVYREVLAEGGA